jgi:nucleotide-binding universal stress UspA family protein
LGVIVVGIDHSEGAKAALHFALAEAALRQARLRVVYAWQPAYVAASLIPGSYPGLGGEPDDLRGAAEFALEAKLQENAPAAGEVEIERRVVEGAPVAVLVDESRDAELLVVGSRGLGGFSGLLLGSVSQQCAHHAACPVVIVRAPAETTD